MKHLFAILLMVSMFIFIGCDTPEVKANIVVPEDEVTAEEPVVEEPVVEEPVAVVAFEEPIVEEPIVLTVKSYWMNPIDDSFEFYYFCEESGLVYGFNGVEKELVTFTGLVYFNEKSEPEERVFHPKFFFVGSDGNLYTRWCNEPEHYDEEGNPISNVFISFKQVDGVISLAGDWEMNNLFEQPEYDSYESVNFKVTRDIYGKQVVSDVFNLYSATGGYRFIKVVDSYEVTEGDYLKTGLFYSVYKSGHTENGRLEGLYFFIKERTFDEYVITEKGRIWPNNK